MDDMDITSVFQIITLVVGFFCIFIQLNKTRKMSIEMIMAIVIIQTLVSMKEFTNSNLEITIQAICLSLIFTGLYI